MVTHDTAAAERGGKPLVSVIIPTYNRAGLVCEALDSVFAQEGAGDRFEMEVVVVDDASSDDTPKTLERYGRVHYIRFETNRGESAARNVGVKASRGKYVAFLDDDDLWLPHRLRMHLPVLEERPEVGAVYGQNILRGEGINDVTWPDASRAPSGNVFEAFLIDDFISINTVLVRREALERAGAFDENLKTMQYYDVCLRLAFHVPFVFVPGNVAVQRYSRGGEWTTTLVGGVYEQTHTQVVERGLAMLPATAEHEPLRRRVRAALFGQIVNNLASVAERGWTGFDRMYAYLLASLEASPWMLTEPAVRSSLVRSACRIARTSESPIAAVRDFCAKVQAAAGPHASRTLLADVWANVATQLGYGSHPRVLAAGYAATRAAALDPTKLMGRWLPWTMVRAVVGPRADVLPRLMRRLKG